MYLVTLLLCVVHVVYSADYLMSEDLFSNEYSTPLHYGADYRDDTQTGGDGQVINLNATFSLLGLPFDVLTVILLLNLDTDARGGGPLNIIAPHFRNNENIDSFRFTINHINRDEQLSGSSGTEIYVGAAVTELKRIAGEIDDCNRNTRTTTTIEEAVIVTWKHDDGTGKESLPQAVLALTSDDETYVLMLFKDSESDVVLQESLPQAVLALTSDDETYVLMLFKDSESDVVLQGFISNDAAEFTEICLANEFEFRAMRDIPSTSNCQCAQRAGIYIFNTTSAANGCDATGSNSCEGYVGLVDETANLNPNCREPVVPQETCKASYYCQVNKTSSSEFELNIVVHDVNLSNYTFVNSSEIPTIQDFADPGKCSGAINNKDRDTITITDTFASPFCVQDIAFALWFYDNTENTITQDGSKIIQGICDVSDLVNSVADTIDFLPPFSTVVPKRTFATEIGFTDRREGTGAKIYSTEVIYPGTIIYLYTCFKRDDDFNHNADAFGHYTHSCTFSGNPTFTDPNQMHSQSIDQFGCPSSSRNGLSGDFQREFEYNKDFTDDQSQYDWCQVSGAIYAFKWINTKRLYVRCYIDFCKNYDDMENTQCWDSCDPSNGRKRRKRQVDDERITLTASITIGSNYTSSRSGKKCVDPTTAIATLSGLVSALVIATAVCIVLFVKIEQRKRYSTKITRGQK